MIDLNPHHLGTVRRILAAHVPACEIRAFGSRATWTAKDYSDLDLAVVGEGPLEWGVLGRLQEAFEESDLPMRVDVLDWHTIPARFREVIERDYVVLHHGMDGQSAAACEWKTVGEVAPFAYGKGLPKKKRNSSGQVPVFGSNGIVGYHDTALTDGPAVIIGRKGTAGAVHYSPTPCWPIDTTFFVTDNDPDLLRFKYYALQCLGLDKMNTDSAVPGLNRGAAHARELYVPAESEQRAIAHVLGTLDDKIELNRRMNETLEAMARAFFQDWFVDFGPTRAKLAGHPPYLPSELWALFPARLVDSELGEIPAGWEVRAFARTVQIIGGGTPKTSVPQYWNGNIPWFAVVDAPSAHDIWAVDTQKKLTPAGIQNSSTQVLPERTTIISARGTVGRVALVGVPMAMNQSCYGLRGVSDKRGFYTYYATRALVSTLQQQAHGSVFGTITRRTLEGIPVAYPPSSVIHTYESAVRPTLERIRSNVFESRTLAALRDTLLPKLVSGEVRVDDIVGAIGSTD